LAGLGEPKTEIGVSVPLPAFIVVLQQTKLGYKFIALSFGKLRVMVVKANYMVFRVYNCSKGITV